MVQFSAPAGERIILCEFETIEATAAAECASAAGSFSDAATAAGGAGLFLLT